MGAWIEILFSIGVCANATVAPLMGAWIEIAIPSRTDSKIMPVAPLMGAWIEMHIHQKEIALAPESRPSWARGLKNKTKGV